MNISNCLPYYFAVKCYNGFRLFRITIDYKNSDTPVNISWPEGYFTLGLLSHVNTDSENHPILLQKWDDSEPISCVWKYDGSEVEMKIQDNIIVIPVIKFLYDKDMYTSNTGLPENSKLLNIGGIKDGLYKPSSYWRPQVYN